MKQKNWFLILLFIIAVIFFVILSLLMFTSNDYSRKLKKRGYSTKNQNEVFYKKVVTNNTLEDYYNDLANHQASRYEEYYFAKESYDFIELKMSYQDSITKTLTISSNIKTLYTTFNYEVSYNNSYVLLEGNYNNEFSCLPVVNKNIAYEEASEYCQEVQQEISSFLIQRDDLINNR